MTAEAIKMAVMSHSGVLEASPMTVRYGMLALGVFVISIYTANTLLGWPELAHPDLVWGIGGLLLLAGVLSSVFRNDYPIPEKEAEARIKRLMKGHVEGDER